LTPTPPMGGLREGSRFGSEVLTVIAVAPAGLTIILPRPCRSAYDSITPVRRGSDQPKVSRRPGGRRRGSAWGRPISRGPLGGQAQRKTRPGGAGRVGGGGGPAGRGGRRRGIYRDRVGDRGQQRAAKGGAAVGPDYIGSSNKVPGVSRREGVPPELVPAGSGPRRPLLVQPRLERFVCRSEVGSVGSCDSRARSGQRILQVTASQ